MRPRQSPDNPMGFEFPYQDLNLPRWAQDCINTWHDMMEPGNHLKAIFETVEKNLFSHAHAYIQEGMELAVIRYKRLYEEKKVYSFKDYCDKFYIKSHYRALETILAAQIGWELLCNEFQQIPTNVSQCIALSKTFLTDDFGQPDIVASWRWVLEHSKATGKKITAGLINFLVNPTREDEKVKVKVSKKKWEKFQQKIRDSGLAPESVLETLIDGFLGKDENDEDPDSAEPESDIVHSRLSAKKPLKSEPGEERFQDSLTECNIHNKHNDTT